jgi:hypothetical protein
MIYFNIQYRELFIILTEIKTKLKERRFGWEREQGTDACNGFRDF